MTVKEGRLAIAGSDSVLDTTVVTQASGPEAHREVIVLGDPENGGNRQNVTTYGTAEVSFGDTPGVDSTHRLRVTNRTTLFANKNIETKHTSQWEEETSGGTETITHNRASASCDLSVGTASGEYAVRQGTRYIPYDPGNGNVIQSTFVMPAQKTNQVCEIGYGDDENGLFLVRNDIGIGLLIRTDTSGTPSDANIVYQADWNGDKLDGTGPSGQTIDLEKEQLFWVDFLWQGVGNVRWGFKINGEFVLVHTSTHANLDTVPYMRTPTLPIRYKIYNTGIVASASTLKEICCLVGTDGGHVPQGNRWSMANAAARVAVTTRRPILAVRVNPSFGAGAPRRTFRIVDAGFSATTNDAIFEVVHVHGVTAFTGTWANVDATESAVQYSADVSAITADHFHIIDHQPIAVGLAGSSGVAGLEFDSMDGHAYISLNFAGDGSELFVVYATSENATANCWAHITGREFE